MKTLRQIMSKSIGAAFAVCFMAAIFGCGFAMTANAAPGFNGDIAFTRTVGGQERIIIASANGANPRAVPEPEGATGVSSPHWSPVNPDLLLYTAQFKDPKQNGAELSKLYVYNRKTGLSTPIDIELDGKTAKICRQGRWSPTGTQVAFAKGNSIYRADSNGQNVHPVFDADDAHSVLNLDAQAYKARVPAWSPDGGSIAFLVRDLNAQTNRLVIKRDIYQSVNNVISFELGDSKLLTPSWSPDGSHLTVSAERAGRHFLLDIAERNGQTVARELPLPADVSDAIGPEWSPDGSKLIFSGKQAASAQAPANPKGTFELFVVDTRSGLDAAFAQVQPLKPFSFVPVMWINAGASWQSLPTESDAKAVTDAAVKPASPVANATQPTAATPDSASETKSAAGSPLAPKGPSPRRNSTSSLEVTSSAAPKPQKRPTSTPVIRLELPAEPKGVSPRRNSTPVPNLTAPAMVRIPRVNSADSFFAPAPSSILPPRPLTSPKPKRVSDPAGDAARAADQAQLEQHQREEYLARVWNTFQVTPASRLSQRLEELRKGVHPYHFAAIESGGDTVLDPKGKKRVELN